MGLEASSVFLTEFTFHKRWTEISSWAKYNIKSHNEIPLESVCFKAKHPNPEDWFKFFCKFEIKILNCSYVEVISFQHVAWA